MHVHDMNRTRLTLHPNNQRSQLARDQFASKRELVLVLEAAAGVMWEKNTAGWLVAGGCCWSGVREKYCWLVLKQNMVNELISYGTKINGIRLNSNFLVWIYKESFYINQITNGWLNMESPIHHQYNRTMWFLDDKYTQISVRYYQQLQLFSEFYLNK